LKLSIVMPVYDEAKRVGKALGAVDKAMVGVGVDYEVLVVNDGSRDQTAEKVNGYINGGKNSRIQLLSYTPNKGKGYALHMGAERCTGDVVTFLDGDAEVKLDEMASYLSALDHTDLVIGCKYHPESVVKSPLMRRFLSNGFRLLVALMLKPGVCDTQSGVKLFRTSALRRILPLLSVKHYAFDVEVLTVAKLLGLRVKEVPVQLELKCHGFSPRAIIRMFVDLLGIAYRMRVLGWYQKNMNNHHPMYKPIVDW